MTPNPYSPPKSDVELHQPPVEIPPEVAKKIKNAWVAALVSAAMTTLLALIAVYGGQSVGGIDGSALFDVALILGLAFGIYKRSRACAVIMLVYFFASKIILFVDSGKVQGIFLSLVFLYFYWQGAVGTFASHRHIKS